MARARLGVEDPVESCNDESMFSTNQEKAPLDLVHYIQLGTCFCPEAISGLTCDISLSVILDSFLYLILCICEGAFPMKCSYGYCDSGGDQVAIPDDEAPMCEEDKVLEPNRVQGMIDNDRQPHQKIQHENPAIQQIQHLMWPFRKEPLKGKCIIS